MKKNGFTLIELVVVIVILGILAAVAAPKFMDLQSDARISAINGLSGALKSAVNMSFAKSIIQGTDKTEKYCGSGVAAADCAKDDKATEVYTQYGIPAAELTGIIEAMQNTDSFLTKTAVGNCDADSQDWCVYTVDTTNHVLVMAPKSSVGLVAKGDYTISGGNVSATTNNTSCALVYAATPDTTSQTTKFNVVALKGGC